MSVLPFHVFQVLYLDVLHVTVDVYYNGYGHCRLGGAYAYGEQGEEESFEFPREQETIASRLRRVRKPYIPTNIIIVETIR